MGFPHPGTGQSMRRIRYKSGNIQSIIMLSFSLLSLAIMLVTVVVMYIKFADASQDSIIESNHKVMDQTIDSVESYLVNMRQVSDSAYYNVIKENDILKQSDSIHDGMSLLYESNKEYLRSIALYNTVWKPYSCRACCVPEGGPECDKTGLVHRSYGAHGKYTFFNTSCTESV